MSGDDPLAEARPSEGMSLSDLAREIPGETKVEGDARVRVFGVRHDSRRIAKRDLFVVRRGETHDGRAFVEKAIEAGAAAVLAAKDVALPALSVPIVRVADEREGLAYAAAAVYGHPAFSLDVVGITGTNGKTTTTHLVRAAIDGAFGGHFCGIIGTIGHSYAGQRIEAAHTTPEADELARVMAVMKKRGATHVAMEVSSIALVLGRVKAVRFRVAAFTNLTQDHLDFHGSMETYAAAKAELFTSCGPGLAVVNVDDPFGETLAQAAKCKVLRVRRKPSADADVAPESIEMSPAGMHIVARTPQGRVEIATRLVGKHNVENMMLALGVASALDLDVVRAAEGLSHERGAAGRLERADDEGDEVAVFVDYAHTPDALARVLDAVKQVAGKGRLFCVFGCGGDRDRAKRAPMGEAVGTRADVAIITSDNPRTEDPTEIAAPIEEGVRSAGMLKIEPAQVDTAMRAYVVELDRRRAIEIAIANARP
ncbi:MAG TPA: UDP-N-acetylmuramoyl-L-alanyl-D-glutamate--2,6-diaminopimelate ligase, partial [Labilithrix sp.]